MRPESGYTPNTTKLETRGERVSPRLEDEDSGDEEDNDNDDEDDFELAEEDEEETVDDELIDFFIDCIIANSYLKNSSSYAFTMFHQKFLTQS